MGVYMKELFLGLGYSCIIFFITFNIKKFLMFIYINMCSKQAKGKNAQKNAKL